MQDEVPCRRYLKAAGQNITHMGDDSGAYQVTKLANQLIVAQSTSAAFSPSMATAWSAATSPPGGRSTLQPKDVHFICQFAESVSFHSTTLDNLWLSFVHERGGADLDYSGQFTNSLIFISEERES